ncbi:kinase-like protein [Ceratobasidium sp. AG-I]|nr:kinase-like protein [Ceratobasidium sp. AG-I]
MPMSLLKDITIGQGSTCLPAISGTMTPSTIITCLVGRGCTDMTDGFDWSLPFGDTRLGTGGFGDVYRGCLASGTYVAIRCAGINKPGVGEGRLAKRLARELYNECKCEHENIIHPIGFIRDQELIALVLPWMENGTLSEYIKCNPDANRYQLCVQITKAVNYLHTIGTVHGDIKGPNVMVSSDGIAKLGDFGNARSNNNSMKFSSTTSGVTPSTRWAAPELFEETASYSKEADVYALAMTILEAVTGQVPFTDVKLNLAVINIVYYKRQKLPRPAAIPTDSTYGDLLWKLLTDCWTFEPSLRPLASCVTESMLTIHAEHSSALANASTRGS